MADGLELPPASEVPIARQDPAFVICDEVRLAALREAEQADSLAAEFVAVSVAFHLWQAQQQAIGPLMERAEEETRNGYNARPFTDWIQRWVDEMSKGLVALGERNNALVAQLGKRTAEEIGTQQAAPRLEEARARIDAVESATTAGMLGDLQAAQRHDEALEPVQLSTREVEIGETEKIRLRKLTGAERSGLSDDRTWAVALAEGKESVVIGLPSDQDLSDALDDQWERPADPPTAPSSCTNERSRRTRTSRTWPSSSERTRRAGRPRMRFGAASESHLDAWKGEILPAPSRGAAPEPCGWLPVKSVRFQFDGWGCQKDRGRPSNRLQRTAEVARWEK